jgi:bacterioferritin (cytochrome b1)
MANQTPTILTSDEILAGLDSALAAEHQAVADYHAHAQACDQPDIREALETLRDVEREHALRLALRIAALGGSPTSLTPQSRPADDTLADWLKQDLSAEQWAIVEYAELVAGIYDDDETVELMTELLLDEIRHARWLKAMLRTLEAD